MSKKDRKQAQQAAIAAAAQRRKAALRNPDLPADELERFRATCAKYFACFAPSSRPCAVPARSRRRGGHPNGTLSHAGNTCHWPTDQEWPCTSAGRPLTCVFQLAVSELPLALSPLSGVQLLQVFIELQEASGSLGSEEIPSYCGGGWVVVAHESTSGLVSRQSDTHLDQIPIAWELVTETYPSYPDNLGIVPDELLKEFQALPQSNELEADTLPEILGTHVGGWPCWLTGGDVGQFVLQLDSDTIGVDLGFDGQIYVGIKDNSWHLNWETG